MAGYYTSSSLVLSTGTELYDTLSSRFNNAGWGGSGLVRTRIVGGRTMTFSFPTTNILNASAPYFSLNGMTFYYPVSTFVAGTALYYTFSASDDHFFLTVRGPNAGATGAKAATYGSPTACFFIDTIKSIHPTDTNADNLQVCGGTYTSSNYLSFNHLVWQKGSFAGVTNAPAELMCTKTAVSDIAAIGELPPSNVNAGGLFGSNYFVVDQAEGLRGQLKNISYVRESYNLGSGDNGVPAVQANTDITSGGNLYITLKASGCGTTGALPYNPFGIGTMSPVQSNANDNCAGPIIAVKRGDG